MKRAVRHRSGSRIPGTVSRVRRGSSCGRRSALLIAWLTGAAAGGQTMAGFAASPTDDVDPFIGTAGTGHTFPGATVPFGMVAPSPDTADEGWDGASGYQYHAPRILGFSNTHMSGTGTSDGAWRTPFDPVTATSPLNNPGDYTEADAYQYTLAVGLYDPAGLVRLFGGPAAAGDWLDRFIATPSPMSDKFLGQEGIIGQYAQGNEPSHHVAYLYGWTDRPWKGHALIARAAREFYTDAPDGLPGNEDAGQMSAWYVFSTLGLYPVVPASGDFVLGAPQVRSARIALAGGRTLKISTDGFSAARPWARRARLNGGGLDPLAVPYRQLVRGGELVFSMAPPPHMAPPVPAARP